MSDASEVALLHSELRDLFREKRVGIIGGESYVMIEFPSHTDIIKRGEDGTYRVIVMDDTGRAELLHISLTRDNLITELGYK